MVDFSRLSSPQPVERTTEPIALFQGLAVRDQSINDLWLAQGDALRQWHENRNLHDISITLNTGAGKTLVGLIIAQSLVNETQAPVVYACSSIQLVEQTAAKAEGYGLPVTTYAKGAFSNDLYTQALAPCITTYQALLNGKSRFQNTGVQAVILDDAHTAGNLLRDQFTLTITKAEHPSAYSELCTLFRNYYREIDKEVGFQEMVEKEDAFSMFLVPPFEVHRQYGEIKRILSEADLDSQVGTMFAWAHLCDKIDLCATFISGTRISFTPPVVPTRTLSYFSSGVRRVYLSASLCGGDAFIRSFGRSPDLDVAPTTTAGECERLILIPHLRPGCEDDREDAKSVVGNNKCLILTATKARGDHWTDVTTHGQGNDVGGEVEKFKEAQGPAVLKLVARFDGVDLPGDTCRLMIIDGLPFGLGPLERFFWDYLGIGKALRSTIASRVTQSFGRISRGMSDHGVVILTGHKLIDWLLTPANRAILPPFLRSQVELGIHISKEIQDQPALASTVAKCLQREETWIRYYGEHVRSEGHSSPVPVEEWPAELAQVEADFGHALWNRDYGRAANSLSPQLDALFQVSPGLGAWYSLWLGFSYSLLDDPQRASSLYRRAHRARGPIHRENRLAQPAGTSWDAQIEAVASYLTGDSNADQTVLADFDRAVHALDGNQSVPSTEEAIRSLGEFFGFDSTRPDQEFGTGPDVLWSCGHSALSLELKTDKEEGSAYFKKDVMQVHDHLQWIQDNKQCDDVLPVLIGPILPADARANPEPSTLVVELSFFRDLSEHLRSALEDIVSQAHPLTRAQVVEEVFSRRNLLWAQVRENLPSTLLTEIQRP